MNKKEIILKIRHHAIERFGSENCYGIQKDTGLSYMQIKNVYDESKQPTFDTILKMCNSVGLEISMSDKT